MAIWLMILYDYTPLMLYGLKMYMFIWFMDCTVWFDRRLCGLWNEKD